MRHAVRMIAAAAGRAYPLRFARQEPLELGLARIGRVRRGASPSHEHRHTVHAVAEDDVESMPTRDQRMVFLR
jgi:hypothetical protein